MSRVSSLRFIQPQLATSVEQPPEGSHWIHEVKHDGYRSQVLLERGRARVLRRTGLDWTEHYPSIVCDAASLDCQAAILDGEAIIQDHNGISNFEALRLHFGSVPRASSSMPSTSCISTSRDLRQQPLSERRTILKALIASDDGSHIQFSEEFVGDADAFFSACAAHELEGIVSKLATSPYHAGRRKTWLKTKCFTESNFMVVGTDRDRKTGALRALLAHPDGDLNYAGAAFIALRDDTRKEFLSEVERLATPKGLFKSTRLADVRWCVPKLTVRVKHLAGSKTLRHATVKSFLPTGTSVPAGC